MASRQTVRRYIMTGAVTAVTVVGAIYGAGLKSQQELNQERQRPTEYTVEDQIRQLEAARAKLVSQKMDLQKKIDDFKARSKESPGS